MATKYCVMDFETFSKVDLKKVGMYEYATHPSTEIMCVAWKIGTKREIRKGRCKTRQWATKVYPASIHRDPIKELLDALCDPDIILTAHNAMFERLIVEFVLGRMFKRVRGVNPKRWHCTASLAAALALPRKLGDVSVVLNMNTVKDKEGHRLMLKWSKPRKPTKNNPATRHTEDAEEFGKIVKYCVTDTDVEGDLLVCLPSLIPRERRVWLLDQTINMRGFMVDRDAVEGALDLLKIQTRMFLRRMAKITGGKVRTPNQRDAILKFIEKHGGMLTDLKAKTVEDALKSGLVKGKARKLLKLRQMAAKTSTVKYQAFDLRSRYDGRLRDILIYHAAAPGRWGGTGVQPHNFPRGTVKGANDAIPLIKERDLDLIELMYGNPMNVFSSCLRGMIVASKGKVLDVGDYSAIEARVLFWVAKHKKGIKAFKDGGKLYEELAADIFSMDLKDVTPDGIPRFVGKQATLGCGYMMGWAKFQKTCADFGQEISAKLAKKAVETYRRKHRPVVELWSNLQKAAIAAIEGKGKRIRVNYTTWYMDYLKVQGRRIPVLKCELPSGRCLTYFRPSVKVEMNKWGYLSPTIYYYGTNSKTKQWQRQSTYGGRLTENVVQAIARDIMAEAMLRIEHHPSKAWENILTVHDEVVAERDRFSDMTNEDFKDLMAKPPKWALGCPIKVEGWSGNRYRK